MRNAAKSIIVIFLAALCGCTKWDANLAPIGFSIVREHLVTQKLVFRNNLPVGSELDFTLTEIDGATVARETIPWWHHMQRGALVPAGAHKFKALAQPHLLPRDYKPIEVSFVATVESRKVYYLIDKAGLPVLVEAHAVAAIKPSEPNQSTQPTPPKGG
jgi:hypothetical protein